jgi:23S rRNA (adenine2503-C2)-methyltransferase
MNLHGLTHFQLSQWLSDHGEKPFRAAQVFEWVYRKGASDWGKMSDLPKSLREELSRHFFINNLELVRTQKAQETTRVTWQLSDGLKMDTVVTEGEVSLASQVGCPGRCFFCASGKKGLLRNLTAGEMVEQVYRMPEKVTHVAFSGMGEPLENVEEVLAAIRFLTAKERLNLPETRITVSTIGIVSGLKRLAAEGIHYRLSIALHAPNQRIRERIIPYARKYSLREIFMALDRPVIFDYMLLTGLNDAPEHAYELAALLKDQRCKINLMPCNPVLGLNLPRTRKGAIEAFREILLTSGLEVITRPARGKDISAAPGQIGRYTEINSKIGF